MHHLVHDSGERSDRGCTVVAVVLLIVLTACPLLSVNSLGPAGLTLLL